MEFYNKREESILHSKSKSFAVRVINLIRTLNTRERVLSSLYDQLLRSGTSIHANIRESEFAHSSSDFINKLTISLKEANETAGWLELFCEAKCITSTEYVGMMHDCNELIALLVALINTKKKNSQIVVK